MTRVIRNLTAIALGAAFLAGCSNSGDSQLSVGMLKSLFTPKKAQSAQVTPEQIVGVLSATPAAVSLIDIEAAKTQGLVVHIETNGPYRTYGSGDRRAIIMRNGMITGTRGFGTDLMSSDAGALISLVSSRSSGTAAYATRILDGNVTEITLNYNCQVTNAGSAQVAGGLINTVGTKMVAHCVAPNHEMESVFVVDNSGRILSARQWIGAMVGHMSVQALRP